MTDRLTRERRSWHMSRVRGRDTAPEKLVCSALHRAGYRFDAAAGPPGCRAAETPHGRLRARLLLAQSQRPPEGARTQEARLERLGRVGVRDGPTGELAETAAWAVTCGLKGSPATPISARPQCVVAREFVAGPVRCAPRLQNAAPSRPTLLGRGSEGAQLLIPGR